MPVQTKLCYKGCIARYKKTELLVSIKGMKTTAKIMVYIFSSHDRPIYFLRQTCWSSPGSKAKRMVILESLQTYTKFLLIFLSFLLA